MEMQRCCDEAIECPGLDHQNKKERPKQNDIKMRSKESRRPGLEHPGRKKRQGPPPLRTGASGDKWRPDAPEWSIRDRTSSWGRRPPDRIIRRQAAA